MSDLKQRLAELIDESQTNWEGVDGWIDFAQQQQALIERLVGALNRIEPERYPPQVFLPMTDKQWHSLKLWCESEGFPIDRLSGNYGREIRAADRAIAIEALQAAKEAGYL